MTTLMEFNPSIRRSEQVARKEPLSNEEVGNLLASFGNSEAKALLVADMDPNVIYGMNPLRKLTNDAQGQRPGWLVGHKATWNWCERSLEPIGVVAMEVADRQSNKYGYLKTKYGDEVGVPLAGLLLDFSKRHPEVSLYQLLGSTNSGSSSSKAEINVRGEAVEVRKRAPATRLKIFRELLKREKSMRMVDLLTAVKEDSGAVNLSMMQLNDFGLLNKSSIEGQKPFVAYKLTAPLDALSRHHQEDDAKRLIQILDSNRGRWLSRPEVVDEFIKLDSADQNLTKDQYAGMKRRLGGHLVDWSRRNLVVVQNFHGQDRSKIELTDKQRALIGEFVNLIDGFQSQDASILKRGRSLANSLTAEDKAGLMAKANEASPFGSNKTSYEEMKSIFLKLIKDCPNISSKSLRTTLRQEPHYKKLTAQGVWKILNLMKKAGLVDNLIEDRTIGWKLTDPNPQS